jgi:LysM repeat protein
VLVRADGRLTREGRLIRTLVGFAVLVGTLILAPRAFASGVQDVEPTHPYVVAEGETLWEIAGMADPEAPRDVVVAHIMRLNNMSSSVLRPGEQILVPSSS